MALFTDAEFAARFLEALQTTTDSDFSITYDHIKRGGTTPRASGLGHCGRQQAYSLLQEPKTNPRSALDNWNALLGGYNQSMVAVILRNMGYTITEEESEVTLANGLITGHLDGELSGLDLGEETVIWDAKFKNVWGLFGTKKNAGIVTSGLPLASVDIYLQMQAYMKARGRKMAIITASPFDMSTTKREAAIKGIEPHPAYRIIVEEDTEAQDLAILRGQLVAAAGKLGVSVVPEYNPHRNEFPCNFCEWRAKCILEGNGGAFQLPPIPPEWTNSPEALFMKEL